MELLEPMTSENGARLLGYTREMLAESLFHSIHVLVKPDADLDGLVRVFDCDQCEMLTLRGWNWTFEEIE
ncbi:hypothetical protein EVC11_014 [Rhizobium phage RHph_I20]|uniref:Uncharacterized protein n=1 Tax=Rhizobium phage RHph_I20 TaxID=2509730 RepID=A0A7S5RFK5_9CAUD|nr:hypothetical protein EVC11_014 [Rhizobium phage RHph_I20]